jgi:hypothetical protein
MPASRERRKTSVALTSTLHWFETEVLAEERNCQGLARLNTDLVQHEAVRPLTRRLILDIDSSESPVYGAQDQSTYNRHFESVCYHPLFIFNQNGDCLGAKLRPGNVHSADGRDGFLLPVIDLSQAQGQAVVERADAAFALAFPGWVSSSPRSPGRTGPSSTSTTSVGGGAVDQGGQRRHPLDPASCHRFRAKEVRLLLGVIAYNVGYLLRRLVWPLAIQT